jgi:hypothetical protein
MSRRVLVGSAVCVSVTIRDESFETPNFLDLHDRLSSDTTTCPPHTKVTLQGASSYIITSTPKIRLSKSVVDLLLFMIW